MQKLIVALFFLSCLVFTACSGPNYPLGHYEGQMESGKAELPGHLAPELISLDISKEGSGSFLIQVQDIHHTKDFRVSITRRSLHSFFLKIPTLGEIIFNPTQYTAKTPLGQITCYKSEDQHLIDLCTENNEFKFTIKDQEQNLLLAITAGRFYRQTPFELEPPKSLSMTEVISKALNMNFASRIEYKKMMQSQDQVAASYLNLLPKVHFFSSVSLVGFALTLNPFSLIYALGDIAPFLFPTHWLTAQEMKYQARIGKDSFRIMQANLAHLVQTQAFKIALYREQKELFEKELRTISQISHEVALLHEKGRMDRYSQYNLESLKYRVENEKAVIESHLDAVLQSLSGTLGFLNIHAITDLKFSPDDLLPVSLKPLDPLLVGRVSKSRSLEVRQIRDMQKAAKLEKISMGFQWLDPAGDPSIGLGFNLIPQIRISDRKLAILMDQEHERLTDAYQSGVKAAELYNGLILGYQRALAYRNDQKQRLDQIVIDLQLLNSSSDSLTPGSEIRSLEIASALQDHLAAELLIPDLIAQQRIAQSKLERLLLIGYLSILHPMKTLYTLSDLQIGSSPPSLLPIH